MIPKIGFLLTAKKFFSNYANGVENYNQKLIGCTNHEGEIIEFTLEDKRIIADGLRKRVEEEINDFFGDIG